MTETLLNDLSSNYEDTVYTSNNDQTNIPMVTVERSTSSPLVRKDSIVIPSLSNNSISSVIQIENNNNNNNTLLAVCPSNSLGKEISFIFIFNICSFYF
jgi:hypothetical protein